MKPRTVLVMLVGVVAADYFGWLSYLHHTLTEGWPWHDALLSASGLGALLVFFTFCVLVPLAEMD